MGCAASKQSDAVLLCRERKLQLKSAMEKRHAFAEAQCKYNQSLYAVAAAVRLFVARHSSPFSQFLVSFPSPVSSVTGVDTVVSGKSNSNPMYLLQQRPSEPTSKIVDFPVFDSPNSSKFLGFEGKRQMKENPGDRIDEEDDDSDDEDSGEEVGCEHFYDDFGGDPPMPSPIQRDLGWDFFNPFSGGGVVDDEDLRILREKEGIPELERVISDEQGGDYGNFDLGHVNANVVNHGEEKGVIRAFGKPPKGRELLEALKDVEDQFIRAYSSGMDVSRMLETNMVQMQSALEEIKDNSSKLLRSLTTSRSTSSTLSWSSSRKSLLSPTSRSSSPWTHFNSGLFDDDGAIGSGCHSVTLAKLYAWEKKLYEEVKAGDETRRKFEPKRFRFGKKNTRGGGLKIGDKFEGEAKILIALRSADLISKRIQRLRDEKLQPQLVELLHGLMRNWKLMSESHETQNRIMSEVKSHGTFCNDSHQLATLTLNAELQNWCVCFASYVSSQKAYIEALEGWLFKFVNPETELFLKSWPSLPSSRVNGPPSLAICHNWLHCLDNLPDEPVTCAMKRFGKEIRRLMVQQGKEHQQKRKVDGLARELDKKVSAFERTEKRVVGLRFSEGESELYVRNQIDRLNEVRVQLDMLRKKVDVEKVKHHTSMQETQLLAVNGFQTRFSSVFESFAEFSNSATKMYDGLITFSANERRRIDG